MGTAQHPGEGEIKGSFLPCCLSSFPRYTKALAPNSTGGLDFVWPGLDTSICWDWCGYGAVVSHRNPAKVGAGAVWAGANRYSSWELRDLRWFPGERTDQSC